MQKKLTWAILLCLLVEGVTLTASGMVPEQTTPGVPPNLPGDFTYIPRSALEDLMQAIADGAPQDQVARMVDIAGRYNLGAYVLHYELRTPQPNTPARGFYHREIAELYYVIRGEGTILLGGELDNATEGDPDGRAVREVSGPTVNGTMRPGSGYATQRIATGDVFILEPGVPHAMGYEVTSPLDVLRVVIDHGRNLPIR